MPTENEKLFESACKINNQVDLECLLNEEVINVHLISRCLNKHPKTLLTMLSNEKVSFKSELINTFLSNAMERGDLNLVLSLVNYKEFKPETVITTIIRNVFTQKNSALMESKKAKCLDVFMSYPLVNTEIIDKKVNVSSILSGAINRHFSREGSQPLALNEELREMFLVFFKNIPEQEDKRTIKEVKRFLQYASKAEGFIEELQKLESLKETINQMDSFNRLIEAMEKNDTEAVTKIMDDHTILKLDSNKSNRILQIAVENKNSQVLESILSKLSIEVHSWNGRELLMCAVKNNDADTVRLLLGVKGISEEADADNNAALKEAQSADNKTIVSMLLKNEFVNATFKKEEDIKELKQAVFNSDLSKVQKMTKLQHIKSCEWVRSGDALLAAIEQGSLPAVIEALLTLPLKHDFFYPGILDKAVSSGKMDLAKVLIEKSSHINQLIIKKYEDFLNISPYVAYLDRPPTKKRCHVGEDIESHIIYNNTGYKNLSPPYTDSPLELGNPLCLDEEGKTPIGYIINLPPKEVKDVLVHVYGGGKPLGFDLSLVEKNLLSNGVAVIRLNLPDLNELNDTFQLEMEQELFDKIHACIHHFFLTAQGEPDKISPTLKEQLSKDVRFFLFGSSFGGLMSLRHAEQYANTFSGYISHDGAISLTNSKKSDRILERSSKLKYMDYLDASNQNNLQKLQDPVALMHSHNDSNVSVKETFSFYKKLRKLNKSHLAHLSISSRGGDPADSISEYYNIGHALPVDVDIFKRYMDKILGFIKGDNQMFQPVSQWQGYIQDKLANKYYLSANLSQRYISEALESERFARDVDLKSIFLAMYYVETLSNSSDAFKAEIKKLLDGGHINQVSLTNLFKHEASGFSQFLLDQNQTIPIDVILSSANLLEVLRKKLLSQEDAEDTFETRYFLNKFYQANPDVLIAIYPKITLDEEANKALQNAEQELARVKSKNKGLVAQVWQHAAKKSVNLAKKAESQEHSIQHELRPVKPKSKP